MRIFNIPNEKKVRVIINTDAKNEVDDQFAIVQALLTESFDLRGLIAAHFGTGKSATSMQDSYDEIMYLLKLMDLETDVVVKKGSPLALDSETDGKFSEGAQLIIEEAEKEEGTLYVAFLGPLTDMASAILAKPEIVEKDIKVIWIGGGNYPVGGWEYNLKNDIHAANVVFKSGIEVWQVPRNVYRMMPVTFAELYNRVYPCGELGKYLTENVIAFNNAGDKRPVEYRVLGDSPAIGVIMYEDCGVWKQVKRPVFNGDATYNYDGDYGNLRVYENIDARFILEDLYAKLKMWNERV